ncbi:MAG: sigma-54-dependent Fis family transcriptional regulator [Nevskiaceae bacterium]|nr:MAG: sigma-54-dependent Fis family transcriptional regulator [Nevskiaceae bacterium]TBR72676.1 MAG: sigma-54-dependent Fis family transcriptional regulator [Nevskiaceae bacterium]
MFDQRMLLMHGFSLGELRRELIERLGLRQTRELFTRLGYQQGWEDYQSCRNEFGGDEQAVETMLLLGPRMRDIEGFVRTQPLRVEIDLEANRFHLEFTWTDSWEAAAHINHRGVGPIPACWMNTGYASGYLTALFGQPFLVRELECLATGHHRCRILGKPLSEWEDIGEDAAFFQSDKLVSLPSLRSTQSASNTGPTPATAPEEHGLVGASAGFNAVVYLLKRVADTDATVLFLGESGVGKEQFARALHRIGPRADHPFVAVNCAGIPQELVEAELFGVEKGAFTGATASRPGRFERADGGTLFLDEIGSLPFAAQGKLLRALQEREIERVGGTTVQPVDVRIVAATNEDLRQAAIDGHFRTDLFHRLNVFPIEIPPLRERREDIPLLFHVFVERFSLRYKKSVQGVTRAALDALWNYDWPGNVRELENMVERSVILSDAGQPIDRHHLFSGGERLSNEPLSVSPMGHLIGKQAHAASRPEVQNLADTLLEQAGSMQAIETVLLNRALERNDGNVSAAARELGLGRGQMQYRLDKRRR